MRKKQNLKTSLRNNRWPRRKFKKTKHHKFGAVSSNFEGTQYKSKLEQYCAKVLALNNINFEYEENTFTLLEKFEWPNTSLERYGKKFKQVSKCRPITYTPDFVGDGWIIETKGFKTDVFKLKWKLFKNLLLTKNLNYDLYAPSNQKEVLQVINIIKENDKNFRVF